eukprot:Awhi_evm2s12463
MANKNNVTCDKHRTCTSTVGRAMGLLGGIEVAELAPLATEPIVLSGAMFKRRDCNFSFAGYKTQSFNILKRLEKEGLPLNDEV